MPENKKISLPATGGDQRKMESITSHGLFFFSAPRETIDIVQESEMTNTEEVNKGIYFSYPLRRHSCAVVNIPAPCVNKIISHIEDMESKIQEHLKSFETSFEEWSRISSIRDLKEDVSIVTSEEEVKQEERDERCPELKQEMETLLSETIHLIKSLETDRADAEEALNRQRARKTQISTKIDSWSIWKLQELPLAVQKEHETYLRDIIELQWNLEDKVAKHNHFDEQKKQLEDANEKIQADIDYMLERCRQLEEKHKREWDALNECYKKKREVTCLFEQIHDELEETLAAYENLKAKALKMKEDINKDIYNNEVNIDGYKKQIDNLDHLCDHYASSIHSANINIEEQEDVVTEVLRETKSTTEELESLTKTLDDLRKNYEQLSWKQKLTDQKYKEALNNYYIVKKSWDGDLSIVNQDYSEISVACGKMNKGNRKLEIDIETITREITESIKNRTEYESEIKSLLRVKAMNDEVLKQLFKEAYHIGSIYHLTRHKVEEVEIKISEVRRKFKAREDFLKKLIRIQVTNAMMIQKRLYSLQETHLQERHELMKKKAIYTLALAEIEPPLQRLEADAERIRSMHKRHSEKLYDVIVRKSFIKRKVAKTHKRLRKRGKKTREALMETEGKRSLLFQEIDTTKSKTVTLQTEISEIDKALKAMEKRRNSFDMRINTLKEKFITVRYKKEQAQSVFDHLTDEKRNCEERMSQASKRFRSLLAMRQNTLAEIRRNEDEALEENLHLAQEYEKMQDIFLTEKDNYLNLYDRQLSLDASLRDNKQLCQLLQWMHKLWREYFKLVVLFSQRKLANFQASSQESIQKILAVQEESSNLMQHIVDFFQTLTDGSCKNDD
ncbi:coiled-coil domain-containing protein 178 [Otolemur garnettii]|uniref:coiled-coil domain-containing protein 178 n=1 Tax=Otolemur garnettii TaxID=30611 RepID=UPI000C7ECBC3|nr:coiled-coil domain-containing protein 178 [Otolemur garnettii]